MFVCRFCQFENASHVSFCGGCGKRIESIAIDEESKQSERTLVDEGDSQITLPSAQNTLIDESDVSHVSEVKSFSKYSGATKQYEIIEEVGRGGMSVVYRARDLKLNREVAIKRLLPEFARNEKSVRRLMAEARSIANLQHAHIVSVYDVDQDQEGPYIAMEYVAGQSNYPETLEDRVENTGLFKQKSAITLITKLSDAVALANSKGIVHRDIKPSNILLTASGQPKLLDFGIAHVGIEAAGATFSGVTREGAVLGTVDYMAPEQESDASKVDARTDVYGLGGVLNYCLTGRSARHYRESQIPERIRSVLSQALETDIENRFSNALDFSNALVEAHGGTSFEEDEEDAFDEDADGLLSDEAFQSMGLPALSVEIRELLESKEALEKKIANLERGVHPDIRDEWLEYQATGQSEQEQINRLEKIAPQLTISTKQSIFSAVEEDEIGSDLSICSQFEKEPQQEVMQYVRQVRRFLNWKKSTRTKRESYEEALLSLSTPCQEKLMELTQSLRTKQEDDFATVVFGFLQDSDSEDGFPLQQWAKVEEGVLRRGYLWGAAEIFRKAESLHAEYVLWKLSESKDTVESIRAYLDDYPQGRFSQMAHQFLDKKEESLWGVASKHPSQVQGFRAYLAQFPQGRYQREATESIVRIEADLWKQIEGEKDDDVLLKSLHKFKELFPDGAHLDAACSLEKEITDWLLLEKKYAYFSKSRTYSNRTQLMELLEQLGKPRTEYLEYLRKSRFGKKNKIVQERILNIEKVAMEAACDIDLIETYRLLDKSFNPHAFTNESCAAIDRIENGLFEDAKAMEDDEEAIAELDRLKKLTKNAERKTAIDMAIKDIVFWIRVKKADSLPFYLAYEEICQSDVRSRKVRIHIARSNSSKSMFGFLLVLTFIVGLLYWTGMQPVRAGNFGFFLATVSLFVLGLAFWLRSYFIFSRDQIEQFKRDYEYNAFPVYPLPR